MVLRKPWQSGLSIASNENLRYLFPATWEVAPPAPRWYVNKAPLSHAQCHASVLWWAATVNITPCSVLRANPGPSAGQDLTTRPRELNQMGPDAFNAQCRVFSFNLWLKAYTVLYKRFVTFVKFWKQIIDIDIDCFLRHKTSITFYNLKPVFSECQGLHSVIHRNQISNFVPQFMKDVIIDLSWD